MALDLDTYRSELNSELTSLLDTVEQEWGDRPDIEVNVELKAMVTVKFNLGDFPHNGRRMILSERTAAGYRKPKLVAREIAREIASHRDACDRCGVKRPSLYYRIYFLQYESSPFGNYTEQQLTEPPDNVERLLYPRLAKSLDRLLETRSAQEVKAVA